MVNVWMEYKNKVFNQLGQSTVEYVLLFGLVSILVVQVTNSKVFKDLFQADGEFVTKVVNLFEYTYRHAGSGSKDETSKFISTDGEIHESYYKNGKTRFFAPKEAYK